MTARRGMALIQALVVVAALAAVSAALMLRTGQAVTRLDTRFQADQAALYLDSGQAMVAALLPQGTVHRGQPWAQPRVGVVIDRGTLAWQVDDLQGRFDVNRLRDDPAGIWRAAFVRLATGQGLGPEGTARLADRLGAATVLHPVALRAFAGDDLAALERLLPLLAALPDPAAFNANTLLPEVFAAVAPGLPDNARDQILSHLRGDPAQTPEGLADWATRALGPDIAAVVAALPLDVRSAWFEVHLDARLDTLVLRRSGVFTNGGAQGRVALFLSMPGPD